MKRWDFVHIWSRLNQPPFHMLKSYWNSIISVNYLPNDLREFDRTSVDGHHVVGSELNGQLHEFDGTIVCDPNSFLWSSAVVFSMRPWDCPVDFMLWGRDV